MANVNQAYVDRAKVATDTTCAPLRDRARLAELAMVMRELHTSLDVTIISFNMAQTAADCKPNLHYHGTWSSHCTRGLQAEFPVLKNRACRFVYLDYIRFPGAYRHAAYSSLFHETFLAMLNKKIIDTETEIIVPYDRGLDEDIARLTSRVRTVRIDGKLAYRLVPTPLSGKDYPLYVATDRLFGAIDADPRNAKYNGVKGKISNAREAIPTDEKGNPFVSIAFARTAP